MAAQPRFFDGLAACNADRDRVRARGAARTFHPVIGIAALGSAVVQVTGHDEAVGWALGALRRRAPQARARREAPTPAAAR